MLSFVVRQGRLVPRQKPVPRIPLDWALVRVRLAGICNTDLEILRGYHSFHGTPGHEFVGEVVRCAGRGPARGDVWQARRKTGSGA